MDDGRKITEGAQYKAAKKKGVKIISEDDLMDMVRNSKKEKFLLFCRLLFLLRTHSSQSHLNGHFTHYGEAENLPFANKHATRSCHVIACIPAALPSSSPTAPCALSPSATHDAETESKRAPTAGSR